MKRYILLGFMLALFIGTGLAQNATTIDVNASQQAFIEVPQILSCVLDGTPFVTHPRLHNTRRQGLLRLYGG